jgi:hypothetical protein
MKPNSYQDLHEENAYNEQAILAMRTLYYIFLLPYFKNIINKKHVLANVSNTSPQRKACSFLMRELKICFISIENESC